MSDDKRRLMTLRTTLDGSCHDVHEYDLRACLDDRLAGVTMLSEIVTPSDSSKRYAEHYAELLPLFKTAARGLLEKKPSPSGCSHSATQVLSRVGGLDFGHTVTLYWYPTEIVGGTDK